MKKIVIILVVLFILVLGFIFGYKFYNKYRVEHAKKIVKLNVDKIDVFNDLENINSVGYEIVNKKDSKDNIEDNEILDEKYEQDILEFDYDKEFKAFRDTFKL